MYCEAVQYLLPSSSEARDGPGACPQPEPGASGTSPCPLPALSLSIHRGSPPAVTSHAAQNGGLQNKAVL